MNPCLRVDIHFDVICPWCLIGLRRFQQARAELQAQWPQLEWDVRWHGAQLLPDVPRQGYPFLDFYLRRLGGPVALRQRQDQVRAAAADAGVSVNYERIAVMPNTADAHRLIQLAARLGSARQEALLERLMRTYFEDGEDLGRADVLLHHGSALGLGTREMEDVLDGAAVPYAGGAHGGFGVPRFVFNHRSSLSGAQPAATLLNAMKLAVLQAEAA